MANKLRAFISSTMEDLGNERRAVAHQLQSMGLEPIHAETISPGGGSSWDTINAEIERCHLFVLILGDRYGWVPDTGYGEGSGLSVTHHELNAARASGKVVLAFMKKLSYGSSVDLQRDALRKEVSDWETGVFRQEFLWADELASGVQKAVTELWTDALLRDLVRQIDRTTSAGVNIPARTSINQVPPTSASRILLAGAGMSIVAGYPTAMLLMNILARDIWGSEVDSAQLLPHNFSDLASYYEIMRGRSELEKRVVEALNTPQVVSPTPAHLQAVKSFKAIVTTNYDELFERACEQHRIKYRVLHPFDTVPTDTFDGLSLYKIVGSISKPDTLILTTNDLLRATEKDVFARVKILFSQSDLVVIGHSLRDGNIQKLLDGRDIKRKAVYVTPWSVITDEIVLSRYGFQSVKNTADEYMSTFTP